MQSARGVTDDHIAAACGAGVDGIKYHRCRVGAFLVAHQIHLRTVCPDLQLVDGSCTEGICRCQQHLFALLAQVVGKLADGGGLAHPVYSDDQNHAGFGGKVQLAGTFQHLRDDLF